jgi:hypothetical protein
MNHHASETTPLKFFGTLVHIHWTIVKVHLVGFGGLDANNIKGLTSLLSVEHES